MSPHTGTCANCQAAATVPAGWAWCCWNPIGCACVAAVTAHLAAAQERAQ